MIRIRTEDGQLLDIPPTGKFVEITDLEGNLAAVSYVGVDGSVHLYTLEDPQFDKYCRLMKINNPVKVLAVDGN